MMKMIILMMLALTPHSIFAASEESWDTYSQQFINRYFDANPEFAVYAGKHEYDGKLSDWSEAGLKKEIERLKAEREKALAFQEVNLNEEQQLDRKQILNQIDRDLFWREIADQPHLNPFWYARQIDPDIYITLPYAPLETRIKSYTTYAKNIPTAIQQIQANMKLPMDMNLLKIGRQTIGGLADFYEKDVPKVFEAIKDESLQKSFKEANEAAIKAVKEFNAWLGTQEENATHHFALGPQKFKLMLKQTEGIDIDLSELEEIGKKDLQRNLDSLKQVCEKYTPGKSLKECIQQASVNKMETKDVLSTVTQLLANLRKFVKENEIVSIPGTEEAKVAISPPYRSWNSAYINIPGPYEKNLPSIYYISLPDPKWDKKKQEDYMKSSETLLIDSVHEVYPGHFVHFLHVDQIKSVVRKVFLSYVFGEGWAHYTEQMMVDVGLGAGDPKVHIAQLKLALLRDVRFLSAIGLHTKGMTLEESKKMFMDIGIAEGEAEQQAARGTFDPAYLNYTLGKLMILKLREDWTATRGGRKAWKQFHDTFLSYGAPPISLVREAMMGPNDKGSLFDTPKN